MKSPTGKGVLPMLNPSEEKSGLPTTAEINGVSRSFVRAVTTPPNAAPITTPTAISTTFPRRMNFLKPSSISRPPQSSGRHCNAARQEGQEAGEKVSGVHCFQGFKTEPTIIPDKKGPIFAMRLGTLKLCNLETCFSQILIGMTIYRYL